MQIDGRIVRFLIDCGATVNLVTETLIAEIGRRDEIRPAAVTLRMFDKTRLSMAGMIVDRINFSG